MPSALTKPTITLRGTNRMSFATPNSARPTWSTPPRMTAAIRYRTPCSCTSGAITRDTAPVAAEIWAGRPPVNAVVTAIVNDANSPTCGSTPAITENDSDSGISASATTRAASTSVRATRGESQAGRAGRGTAIDGNDTSPP